MTSGTGDKAHVQGILLAAGQGRRWTAAGGQGSKLLHPLPDGRPVALAAAQALRRALPDVLAVVDPRSQQLAGLLRRAGVQVMESAPIGAGISAGLGDNLAAAVRATGAAAGWLVALGDMPWIRPATVAALAHALRTGHRLVAPSHRGQRGHPVGFAACFGAALGTLSGDTGARELLRGHTDALVHVPVDDPGVLLDLDEPADAARCTPPPADEPSAWDLGLDQQSQQGQ